MIARKETKPRVLLQSTELRDIWPYKHQEFEDFGIIYYTYFTGSGLPLVRPDNWLIWIESSNASAYGGAL